MLIDAVVQDGGLGLGEIIAGIPHDGPAVLVYVMLAVFGGLIWWGSRSGRSDSGSQPTDDL